MFFGARVWIFLICGLVIWIVFDDESDIQVKVAQFQRPEVEHRASRFLIVGFLIVCFHVVYMNFFMVFCGCLGMDWMDHHPDGMDRMDLGDDAAAIRTDGRDGTGRTDALGTDGRDGTDVFFS